MEINEVVKEIRKIQNEKGHLIFWDKKNIQKKNDLTIGEALCMAAGELNGEAMEAYRDDDIINFRKELGDAILRIFHIAGETNTDLESVIDELLKECKNRPYKHGRKNF